MLSLGDDICVSSIIHIFPLLFYVVMCEFLITIIELSVTLFGRHLKLNPFVLIEHEIDFES